MHVRLGAADFMHEGTGPIDNLVPECAMGERLDPRCKQRPAQHLVPRDVQMDLAVIVSQPVHLAQPEAQARHREVP